MRKTLALIGVLTLCGLGGGGLEAQVTATPGRMLEVDGTPFFPVAAQVPTLAVVEREAEALVGAGFNCVLAAEPLGAASIPGLWAAHERGMLVLLDGAGLPPTLEDPAAGEGIQHHYETASWTREQLGYLGWLTPPLGWQGQAPEQVDALLLAARAGNPAGLAALRVDPREPARQVLRNLAQAGALVVDLCPDGLSAGELGRSAANLERISNLAGEQRPWLALLPGTESEPGALDAPALRYLAATALVHGAAGLIFASPPPQDDHATQAQDQVAGELLPLRGLLAGWEALLAVRSSQPQVLVRAPSAPRPDGSLSFALVAVNLSAQPVSAQISGLPPVSEVRDLVSGDAIPVQDGTLPLTLPGHGVALYLGPEPPPEPLVRTAVSRMTFLSMEAGRPLVWTLRRYAEVQSAGLMPYPTPDGTVGFHLEGRALLMLPVPNRSGLVDAARLTRFTMRMFCTGEGQGALLARSTGGEVSYLPLQVLPGWHTYELDLASASWQGQEAAGQRWGGSSGLVDGLTFTPPPLERAQLAFDWIRLEPPSEGEVHWELGSGAQLAVVAGVSKARVHEGRWQAVAEGPAVFLEPALPAEPLAVESLPFLSLRVDLPAAGEAQVEYWLPGAEESQYGGGARFAVQAGVGVYCVELGRLGFGGGSLDGSRRWGGPEEQIVRWRLTLPTQAGAPLAVEWLRLGPNYDLRAAPVEEPLSELDLESVLPPAQGSPAAQDRPD